MLDFWGVHTSNIPRSSWGSKNKNTSRPPEADISYDSRLVGNAVFFLPDFVCVCACVCLMLRREYGILLRGGGIPSLSPFVNCQDQVFVQILGQRWVLAFWPIPFIRVCCFLSSVLTPSIKVGQILCKFSCLCSSSPLKTIGPFLLPYLLSFQISPTFTTGWMKWKFLW